MKKKSISHSYFVNRINPLSKSKCSNSRSDIVNSKKIYSMSKRSQISFEYLIIMGFITFVIIGILGIALFYSGGIKDRIKITQMTDCANKIISTAESVFYSGYPSRATRSCYLPEGIQNVTVYDNALYFKLQTSTGDSVTEFSSNVRLYGEIMATPGLKKIMLTAENDRVKIN